MKTDDTNKCIVCFIYFILEDLRQNAVLFDPQEATLWLLIQNKLCMFPPTDNVKESRNIRKRDIREYMCKIAN